MAARQEHAPPTGPIHADRELLHVQPSRIIGLVTVALVSSTADERSAMSGDFDPRDFDSRDRNDGIHDREDEWLRLGRGPGSAAARDGEAENDHP